MFHVQHQAPNSHRCFTCNTPSLEFARPQRIFSAPCKKERMAERGQRSTRRQFFDNGGRNMLHHNNLSPENECPVSSP